MFKHVYTNPRAKGEEKKAEDMLALLFRHYEENLELLPKEYLKRMEERRETPSRAICDYIAGMTDRFAVAKFRELTIPRSWSIY